MQSCLPVSSPDQGVYAVTHDLMVIMFAKLIMRAPLEYPPRYATLWKQSMTCEDLETRFQNVSRRSVEGGPSLLLSLY